MRVSGFGNPIIDALLKQLDDKSDDAPARKLEEAVSAIFKKASESAYQSLYDDVRSWLLTNMEDAIRDSATRLAEKYIKSALAGDEKTFIDLFDFKWDWQRSTFWMDETLPLGVKLRREILKRHHDLFEAKIIEDLEGEIAVLRKVKKLGRPMVEGDLSAGTPLHKSHYCLECSKHWFGDGPRCDDGWCPWKKGALL